MPVTVQLRSGTQIRAAVGADLEVANGLATFTGLEYPRPTSEYDCISCGIGCRMFADRLGVSRWVLAAGVAVFVWAGCYVVWSMGSPDARPTTSQLAETSMTMQLDPAAPIGEDGELLPPGPDESAPLVDPADYGVYDVMVFREVDDGKYEVELRHRNGPAARVLSVSRYVCVGEGNVATYVLDVGGEGDGGVGKLEIVRCRRTQYTKAVPMQMKGSHSAVLSTVS